MTDITFPTTSVVAHGSSKNRDEGGEGIKIDAHVPVEEEEDGVVLPPVTALMGRCQDGLPVLFDLTDSRTGPLLILGDPGCGKQKLMQQMVDSLMQRNDPEDLQFSVISSSPEKWRLLTSQMKRRAYWMELSNSITSDPGEQVIRLAERTEQKYLENQEKPVILVLVDDLSFLSKSDSAVQLNFSWLCENGPLVQVWLAVALDTLSALTMGRWTRYFKTRVLGKMPQSSSDRLGLTAFSQTEALIPGMQFAVLINNTWYHFNLPGTNPEGRERINEHRSTLDG